MQSSLKTASLLGIAALTALGLAGARPAAAQIITDGSFETLVVPPGSDGYTTVTAGNTLGTGSPWTVSNGSVDVINSYWSPEDGNQSLDLSGSQSGSIYQNLTTTAGTTYNLSYWLAGNPDGSPTVKTLGVFVDGSSIQTATFDTTNKAHANMGWTQNTVSFVASGNSTRLEFESLPTTSTSPYGPALDNVQVTVAPEPSSLTVFAFLGLGMLGLALKARKGRVTA